MYSGQIAHIPLGQLGVLTDVPPGEVPRGALIMGKNISFETGMVTKTPGSSRYNTQVLPAGIVALHDWWPDSVTQRLIAACTDGKIYRDIGDRLFSSATAIASGLGTLTPRCMFVEGGNETAGRTKKLFFLSGTAQMKVLDADGTSFATITNPASDWTTPNFPKVAIVHRNRLWAFMGQRAYGSNTGDHENFTSSYITQSIFPGEGDEIIGAHVFKGRLFAFKQGGFVYYLEDTDTDSANWFWRKLASNFGLGSPHGIFEVDNDMIAINESGSPISYNAVNALGDIESADLLRLLQIEENYRNTVSLNGVPYTHTLYYEAKKQVFITGRRGYQTNNNFMLHIDYNKRTPRVAYETAFSPDCLALRKDINGILRPIYGASDGYVYFMDREDRLVHTTAISGEFKTGHMDFRFLDEKIGQKNKLFDKLIVEFVPQGTWNLSVDVYIDGTFRETITFSMDVRDDGMDTFTLDTDPLGREETQRIEKPLHGSGRSISFHCYQAGSNQNFSIASLSVGFRMSAEQASRA